MGGRSVLASLLQFGNSAAPYVRHQRPRNGLRRLLSGRLVPDLDPAPVNKILDIVTRQRRADEGVMSGQYEPVSVCPQSIRAGQRSWPARSAML